MGWYKLDQEFALVSEWMDNGDITQYVLIPQIRDPFADHEPGSVIEIATQTDCIWLAMEKLSVISSLISSLR